MIGTQQQIGAALVTERLALALGAQQRTVLSSVLRQTATIAAAGIATGVATAPIASVVVSRFLFGIGPRDPMTLELAAATLAITALVAGCVPARRASRVDPTVALRTE